MTNETVGFLGLGLLGMPMATHLVDAGHSLRVYNRTVSKAEPLVAKGAHLAASPADAATRAGIVVSVLWDDAALESVVTSEGFLEALGRGGLHVSMSTVSPETARRMAALHERVGSTYLEAPIFGRPEAAVAKKLWIPVAGPQAAKDRARPLLETMGAQGIFDFGEAVGSAVTVKLAGNFLIISAARSMVEAFSMAEKAGVDPEALAHMLTTTLFTAPIYQSYGKMIVEKTTPVMQSGIPLKDIGLFKHAAEQVGAPAPISSRLQEMLESARPPV
jgi:3-hydroxyisobutyrate dehydrogenase-like beta-hydroxyacid dehydrogenase